MGSGPEADEKPPGCLHILFRFLGCFLVLHFKFSEVRHGDASINICGNVQAKSDHLLAERTPGYLFGGTSLSRTMPLGVMGKTLAMLGECLYKRPTFLLRQSCLRVFQSENQKPNLSQGESRLLALKRPRFPNTRTHYRQNDNEANNDAAAKTGRASSTTPKQFRAVASAGHPMLAHTRGDMVWMSRWTQRRHQCHSRAYHCKMMYSWHPTRKAHRLAMEIGEKKDEMMRVISDVCCFDKKWAARLRATGRMVSHSASRHFNLFLPNMLEAHMHMSKRSKL